MKIKPLGDKVLIKIQAVEERTASGLYIPETAKDKESLKGIVIDRGESRVIEDGDKVIYEKYAGTNVKIDDENHLLIEIKNIIAIIED